MLDCGLHPSYTGLAALPFFDDIDPASVDLLLITHFHVDHAAALPYFMEKTNFKGKVYMTHPTRAIYKWLLSDYVKISSLSPDDQLYDDQDLATSYERIQVVDYHQEVDVGGIKFTPYNAGHVLGAAMFLIEIAGVRLLYTGDYSREEDRHLMAAERPPNVVPEVLICESTYGVQSHEPRLDRETRFTRMVHTIVKRGGRCLLPVFALGRAQELLLILDEYWQAHPDLHNIPIYYASSLAKKCMTVYQSYTNMMNSKIREQAKTSNPFQFKHISNLKSIAQFDDVGPCVMFASPGMLQSGLSRELLELWCVDKRNGCIIPGYVVEGTLGKQILSQPDDIVSMSGARLPLRLTVEYISFSAHVDYKENSDFIEEVGSKNLVLVHGDSNEMGRLRSALQSKYAEREIPLHIHTPRNCETVELHFRGEKTAKIIGHLAAEEPKQGTLIEGVLTSKDFAFQIIDQSELVDFTELVVVPIIQKQTIVTHAPFGLIKWHLEQMYGTLIEIKGQYKVFNVINVIPTTDSNKINLEWDSNPMNDMIADSIVAIILQADSSPASVKVTKSEHHHHHGHEHQHESDGHEDEPKVKMEKLDMEDENQTKIKIEQDHEHPVEEAKLQSTEDAKLQSQYIVPSQLNRPQLKDMMTRFLTLQFGESRIQFKKLESEEFELVWDLKIDKDNATVKLKEDGSAWNLESSTEELKRRLTILVNRVLRTWLPLQDTWVLNV
ncbi:beta-lactamase-like protein, partial [Globomyces pollinis-pini]